MTIPLVNLVAQSDHLRDDVMHAIENVIRKAQFVFGDEVSLFEEEFAEYCGVQHCISVSSGTEALHLTLRAMDIGPGDEVITAANSFAATGFAIAYTGATPVFLDVRDDDYNIDVELMEEAISPRTKAIIPVHLYGQPADMDAIWSIADRYGLKIIEDSCQAHGSRYGDRPTGSLGDAGCFSFYPGKNLGAYGDGGAVTTNNPHVAERLRQLRNYGQPVKYVHNSLGYNARLDTLQAAVLLVKLKFLEAWTERRRDVARLYRELLSPDAVHLPAEKPAVRHVYHLFVVRHEQRDELLEYLKERGIFCGIHYPIPLPEVAPLQVARSVPDGVPVCTALSRQILSLPMYPELTDEQVQTVAEAVNSFAGVKVVV
jgi:dTDP-4-amino-4,6-dideoxygalactose transaminase